MVDYGKNISEETDPSNFEVESNTTDNVRVM